MLRRFLAPTFALALAGTAGAQAPTPAATPAQAAAAAPVDPSALRVAPSGRVRAELTLSAPRVQGQAATPAQKIWIDYGQPHARGRAVLGGLVPYDTIYRFGANAATAFHTDVDLNIGGTAVPRGDYTLVLLASRTGAKLVVSRQTGQWGTMYDAARDLARIDMTTRTLAEPVESFTITLVPAATQEGAAASGRLVAAWGTSEFSVPWRVGR
jgi:hypothetical protein